MTRRSRDRFLMHPEAIGYRMAGSINLGVSEK